MKERPTKDHRKPSVCQPNSFQASPQDHRQHGSLLLDLPLESLTHVTSYLPPPSLLALARTCRHLCEHVDDDNTWLCAFLNQFFAISPEYELDIKHILLLERTENTWRKEFISRYDIRRRWERSRSPTVTHAPQGSSIDGVHLISEYGLLTSSIRYGIVARSIPLNGRVLKEYISASGTGFGIGSPNVELSPNVSACTMSSDGGTARVFWGKRSGEVAITLASRVMDSRASSKFIRCGMNEQHDGAVQQLVPDPQTDTFLSAGADGRVKLWDTKTLRLLWSSDKQQVSFVADSFVSIAGGLGVGFVAGALRSGGILLYGLHVGKTPADGLRPRATHELRIPPPIHIKSDASQRQQIVNIWLYRTGELSVLLFVQYAHHPQFYRVHANVQSRDVMVTSFGDSASSSVSTLEPVVSTHAHNNKMFIVGDLVGFVSFYDADTPLQTCVGPVHRFEAHTDGSVTAISWSPTVFATGSARGTTVVWDSLTLEPMRYFTTPASRRAPGNDLDSVSQVFVDKELVVIIVGNRVMTWKVGQVSNRACQRKKSKRAHNKTNVATKGYQRYDMHKDIVESCRELESEKAHSQRAYGREREQRSTLDMLGLSELEAVEYMLMLSREEAEARRQQTVVEEGVFEGDFDDLPNVPASNPGTSHRSNGRQCPRAAGSRLNEKVQVSPPFVREPMEAGAITSSLVSLTVDPRISSSPLGQFPAISPSLSLASNSRRRSKSASPEQSRSAWATPLKSVLPSSISLSRRSRVGRSDVIVSSVESSEEMDDDLRLAIQLSLAEARSRGEDG